MSRSEFVSAHGSSFQQTHLLDSISIHLLLALSCIGSRSPCAFIGVSLLLVAICADALVPNFQVHPKVVLAHICARCPLTSFSSHASGKVAQAVARAGDCVFVAMWRGVE